MEKPKWPAKQWDERLKQRLLEEPPFEPAAWEAMEALLDNPQRKGAVLPPESGAGAAKTEAPLHAAPINNKRKKNRKMLPYWFAAAASFTGLLALLGLWWGIGQYAGEQADTGVGQRAPESLELAGAASADKEPEGAAVDEAPDAAPLSPPVASRAAEASGADEASRVNEASRDDEASKLAEASRLAEASKFNEVPKPAEADRQERQASSSGTESSMGRERRSTAAIAGLAENKALDAQTDQPTAAASADGSQVVTTTEASEEKSAAPGFSASGEEAAHGLVMLERIPFQAMDLEVQLPVPLMLAAIEPADSAGLPAEEAIVASKPRRLNLHRWSLAVAGAPDMSQAGSFSTTGAGGGGGLLLAYQFGKRLRLQTGAIYTKKNYQSYEGFVPYGGSGGYPDPNYIDASCGVIDLPLNLQYQFAEGKRFRWYASGGISSYLMRSERYLFVYNYKNYEYNYKNENKHWFSVLNAGVGVETPISKRLSLQAEPYFKLPISGVGAGNIRLTSFGALLQLRYDF